MPTASTAASWRVLRPSCRRSKARSPAISTASPSAKRRSASTGRTGTSEAEMGDHPDGAERALPVVIFVSRSFAWRRPPSLYRHDRRSAFVLDHDHHEFRRLGRACVPVDEVNVVGAFIEALSRCQCYRFSPLQLHHNRALQDVNERMRIVSVDGARPAGRMLY